MKHNFEESLLERLYNFYPETHPCRMALTKNYRSHSDIVKLTSKLFYDDKLEACANRTRHPQFPALTFFAAQGSDEQDFDGTGYFNVSEVKYCFYCFKIVD